MLLCVIAAIALMWLVCSIIAAFKAWDGKAYRYPLTIRLLGLSRRKRKGAAGRPSFSGGQPMMMLIAVCRRQVARHRIVEGHPE